MKTIRYASPEEVKAAARKYNKQSDLTDNKLAVSFRVKDEKEFFTKELHIFYK